jgi:hypothetical protein
LFECAPPGPAALPEGKPHIETKPGELFWFNAEYLLWWTKTGPQPGPLVTTGSTTTFGALGSPDTHVLFGGSGWDYDAFSGGRFGAGFWFDRGCSYGLEASGFLLETRPIRFEARSDASGAPVLARPVVNALFTPGLETVELISAPNVATGAVSVSSTSNLWGWEIDFTDRFYDDHTLHVDLLVGFRYLHLDEDIDIAQASNLLPGGIAGFAGSSVAPPSSVAIFDHFDAVNRFYGLELGARTEYKKDHVFVNLLTKVALGSTNESVHIAGASVSPATSGGVTAVPGGLLALASNSGHHTHDDFAVVPELGFNIGYQITPLLRAYIGYTLLYWSDVVRPGAQMSRTVNPALIPTSTVFGTPGGPLQPAFVLDRTDFWAQGINFGLEFRY